MSDIKKIRNPAVRQLAKILTKATTSRLVEIISAEPFKKIAADKSCSEKQYSHVL